MKHRLSLAFVLVASLVTTGGYTRSGRHEAIESSAAGSIARARGRARDVSEVRRRIKQGEPGTYIGEILLTRDSSLTRWRERTDRPLRVWIQPIATIPDWDPEFIAEVRNAFREWMDTGIPVRFTFVSDSSHADVHVRFVDRFRDPISGKTRWARDEDWWIVDGDIVLAVHHDGGEALDHLAVRAIALHEVGHLLGLDHSADISNIMTARVRVRELSDADRQTMRLLYTLPPGPVR